MIMNAFDSTLAVAYKEFDVPVDRFLADYQLTEEFVATVADKLHQAVESPQVMRRLMNLRKKGKLPRLRRAYHGRQAR